MKSMKRFSFPLVWLVVLALLPGAALATKRIYKAKIQDPRIAAVKGGSIIHMNYDGSAWEFMVTTRAVNNSVSEVWLRDPALGKQLPLCGAEFSAEAVCTHDADGNLDLSGLITSGLLFYWGQWRGSDFKDALDNARMQIFVYHGSGVASGTFSQIFP